MRRLLLLGLLALPVWLGCFPHRAGSRLSHFPDLAPQTGEAAPDFELRDLDGELVRLSELFGEKPIVLQLGSYSCPVFRNRRPWVEELIEEFAGRVRFVIVYTLEAHPAGSKSPYADDEWLTWFNRLANIRVPQHESFEERREQAILARRALDVPEPILVDELDNDVWKRFGAASSPAFVLDRHGRVRLRQPWIVPQEIRRTLYRLLEER